jgi:hypothetical protein
VAFEFSDAAQDGDCFASHFRADAVAGDYE